MVSVVGELVKHPVRSRVHLYEPVEAPDCLVHDIRNTIPPGQTTGQTRIVKLVGKIPVSCQQMIHRVGRCCNILEIITGIMPPSVDVQIRAVWHGTIKRIYTFVMTTVTGAGIEAAALLSHITQTEISSTIIQILFY